MMPRTRTAGDGMESGSITTEPTRSERPSRSSLIPGRLIQVFPKNTIKIERPKSHIHSKSLKFVPYEPYPAAVKPIVPQTSVKSRKSRNNMDINTLISQMSQMDTNLNEFKPKTKLPSTSDKRANKPCPEKTEMQKKIDEMMKENELLKEQLKQQAQVNKELKTMLVASMGEDLETQVNTLNEDKKHLANALLNSSQHLSTHQEQTEWLAGQCEVWRSKFLASSLMVEELANWKKLLNERSGELRQAITLLLDERCRAREMMICTYRNLSTLHNNWLKNKIVSNEMKMYNQTIGSVHLGASTPHSSNVLDLASVNMKLSENISSSFEKDDVSMLNNLPSLTDAEQNAENIMALPLELSQINEEPVAALVSHAYSSSGSKPRPVASCQHCNGKVQLL